MKKLKAKLEAARNAAGNFEFGTQEWETAMQKVRALVDEINVKFPPAPWGDREWSDMMSR